VVRGRRSGIDSHLGWSCLPDHPRHQQEAGSKDFIFDGAFTGWSEKFGVSRDKLRGAVAQVGPMVKKVREHLQRTA
jgi:hypothetical protein